MTSTMFKSFAKEAMAIQIDPDTPPDYEMTKQATLRRFPGLQKAAHPLPPQMPPPQTKTQRFMQGASGEVGPAAGAVLGAGIAGMYNVNPLAGAAAGYGIGAIPEIVHSLRHRV
jgi:hypothetical protein